MWPQTRWFIDRKDKQRAFSTSRGSSDSGCVAGGHAVSVTGGCTVIEDAYRESELPRSIISTGGGGVTVKELLAARAISGPLLKMSIVWPF